MFQRKCSGISKPQKSTGMVGMLIGLFSRVFASSDSSFVIEEITRRYGDRAFFYPSVRSCFGEMHVTGLAENAGLLLKNDYDMPANNRLIVWKKS